MYDKREGDFLVQISSDMNCDGPILVKKCVYTL